MDTNTPLMTCPDCGGDKTSIAFVDGRDHDGKSWGDVRRVACFTCKGVGEITQEHMVRIKAGKAMREDRVRERLSLREKAAELNISAAELSALERGNAPIKEG